MSSRFAGPPCPGTEPALGLVPPPPGQPVLRRRVGDFDGFVADLVRAVETGGGGEPALAHAWDLAGDPQAATLARLWAYVAETVAAYAELTAGEGYVGTAADWTDLRRLAALVGYRPRGRVAAQGWVRAEVDPAAAPLVPAGTRVQSPAAPGASAQTFEAAEDTQLRGEWGGLTATWKLDRLTAPSGRRIRFAGDPGFRAGHQVLFLERGTDRPLALATVSERTAELGTSLVTFDRDLTPLHGLASAARAFRVVASAATARRLGGVLTVTGTTVKSVGVTYGSGDAAVAETHVVLDALLTQVSAGGLAAVVSWGPDTQAYALMEAKSHAPVDWEVAPGTTIRTSRVDFAKKLPKKLLAASSLTLYVVDGEAGSWNLVPPSSRSDGLVRLHPGPVEAPPRLALRTAGGWQVFGCTAAPEADQEAAAPRAPGDPLVVLLDPAPDDPLDRAEATGNVFRVRHGRSASAVLGSGDARRAGLELAVRDAPVAHDLDAAGTPVSSLAVRVDAVLWDEAPTLYDAGPARVYTTRLGPDGGVTVEFGDGLEGARPATGRNNVTAAYRVGGGVEGEVGDGAITALLGHVRGVRKVAGGPTSGGADQDAPAGLRRLAPARARAFGRVVSREDAADLALAYPGVTHAAAWDGGASGVTLAFLRSGESGPKAPSTDEVAALVAYLSARRDPTFPLHVTAARLRTVTLDLTLALDPAYVPATVRAAVAAAIEDPASPVSPTARALGQPFDPSDVYPLVHGVPGVVGVAALAVDGAAALPLDRVAAKRDELLLLAVGTVA